MAARLIKFAVSDMGQRVIRASISVCGVGSVAYNLIPYTVLLDKYRELHQLYK